MIRPFFAARRNDEYTPGDYRNWLDQSWSYFEKISAGEPNGWDVVDEPLEPDAGNAAEGRSEVRRRTASISAMRFSAHG